jgi:tetratricopeptide (TPR) repeat protein
VAETREALRLDPRNTKYKQRLVEWEEYFQKKREQAERNARMDALNAARKRGIDLYEKNDYRGAEAAFREVIRIFPDNAGSHYNLGLALEYQKRWSEAVDAYREAMRLNPNYSKARDNLRQAEAELRKEREWQARREEERREREQDAQRKENISRVLADLKKEKPSPSEGFPIRIKPFPGMDPLKGHAEVDTSPSIHGLGGMKTAGQQLTGAAALGEGAGRKPFDTWGPAGRPLNIPKHLGRNPWKAPVVTDEDRKRVPAIRKYEGMRSAARKRRVEYQAKLEELKSLPESEKPRDWSVQVAEAEQNASNAGNEEIYYNFQIGEALRKSNIPK